MRARRIAPALTGLILGFGGPLLPLVVPLPAGLSSLQRILIGEIWFWIIGIALILIVRFWERRPLASIGLSTPNLRTLGTVGIGFAAYIAATALAIGLFVAIGGQMPDAKAPLAQLAALPAWLLPVLALRAGIVEELITRGFGLERLAELTGSRWFAAGLQLVLFAALHIPFWGVMKSAGILLTGGALTLLYLFRRDLAANMILHAAIDGMALAAVGSVDLN